MAIYGTALEEQTARLPRTPNLPILPSREDQVIAYLVSLDRAIFDIYVALSELVQVSLVARGEAVFGAATTSVAVLFNAPVDDADYHLTLTPTWSTTCWFSLRATTGFTVHVGTAPGGGGGSVFWTLIR
jgi:hypothetical protein